MGFSLSLCFSILFLLAISDHAYGFGAGNIASLSRIEGQNWRHGDIEDTLLSLFMARVAGGRKFSKLDVKRVYFGNWLRDYSQAVDVGTVKYVSAEAIRILLWILGFMSFGYGTKEFEVTTERLGCYQPTEHIDNPLGYAEGEDARSYDRRLRAPIDEDRELSFDTRTGLKNYIASEDLGIDTSAGLIRRVLGRSIQLGRQYGRSRNDTDLHEALRLLGTGLHCLEDYAAHSNYIELSLIELGERGVFPHVGSNTKLTIRGSQNPVYGIVTGTFGGVDFFHSVLGEITDKTTQSEIQSLEGVITDSENDGPSENFVQNLLSKIPSGLLGDNSDDEASKMDAFKAKSDNAKHNNSQNVSPREPEEWARYLSDVQKQIYPVLEWHDNLLKNINQAIEKIPVLPDLIEQLQSSITLFVFSIIAPYVLPVIKQVKSELETGSSEVIQSSRDQQHIVFNDSSASNPTHSMLSKDHFSNVLNEPAGRIAAKVVEWVVPQLMQCWDDENSDIDRTLTRIINGVFHHPVQRRYGDDGASDCRQIMFSTVQDWWSKNSGEEVHSLREQLSRDGVLEGKNHKPGVQDCGHGCGKPISLPKAPGNSGNYQASKPSNSGIEKMASEAVGGGALGGLLGGIVGGMGSMILNSGHSEPKIREDKFQYEGRPHHNEQHESRDNYEHHQSETYGRTTSGGYQYENVTSTSFDGNPAHDDYGRQNVPSNDYPRQSHNDSINPSSQSYCQEGHQQYRQEDNGMVYKREERQEYQSNQSGYYQSESRFESSQPGYMQETQNDSGLPPAAFDTMQSTYGRQGFQQEPSSGYGMPGGFEDYERPNYPPQESRDQRFGGGEHEKRREHDHGHGRRYERRQSNSSGSDNDRESHRRHERHHNNGSGSGSESSPRRNRQHRRRRSGSGSD